MDTAGLLEAMQQALREEFGQLRAQFINEVQIHLRDASPSRGAMPHSPNSASHSPPGAAAGKGAVMQREGSAESVKTSPFEVDARTSTGTLNCTQGSRAFRPVCSYKVGELSRWLTEAGGVPDLRMPSNRMRANESILHDCLEGGLRGGHMMRVHPIGDKGMREPSMQREASRTGARKPLGSLQDAASAWADKEAGHRQPDIQIPGEVSQLSTHSTGSDRGRFMGRPGTGADRRTCSVQLALGLNPNERDADFAREQSELKRDPIRGVLTKVVRSTYFDTVSLLMIMSSAILIGLQTDYMARHSQAEAPVVYIILDYLLLVYFLAECAMRLYVFRRRFFTMWGWGWNVFDLALIIFQLIETVFVQTNLSSTTLIRLARILRTVRVLRVIRVMRVAQELRLLVSCILHSAQSFYWATILIMTMVYIFAVHFAQIALIRRLEDRLPASTEGPGRLTLWFGTVPRSALSLFQGLTGGVDWNDLVEPLMQYVSPWMGTVFFLYISFAMLCVMNVVMATFVQNAIERAAEVHEAHKVFQASRLFQMLDSDHQGTITLQEIVTHLESPEVREFFRSIDVDVSEACILFDMLDTDNSGSIEFAEFIAGCMRLQGPAKTIDLVQIMREIRETLEKLKAVHETAAGAATTF